MGDSIVTFNFTINKNLNKHIQLSTTTLNVFTGATSSDLVHYVIHAPQEGCYEQRIINKGIDDVINGSGIGNTVLNFQRVITDIVQNRLEWSHFFSKKDENMTKKSYAESERLRVTKMKT